MFLFCKIPTIEHLILNVATDLPEHRSQEYKLSYHSTFRTTLYIEEVKRNLQKSALESNPMHVSSKVSPILVNEDYSQVSVGRTEAFVWYQFHEKILT